MTTGKGKPGRVKKTSGEYLEEQSGFGKEPERKRFSPTNFKTLVHPRRGGQRLHGIKISKILLIHSDLYP